MDTEGIAGWRLTLRKAKQCDTIPGQISLFDLFPEKTQDEYIKENPTCFYVFGYYLDKLDGWHKVPEELPVFKTWCLIDAVCFGKKTGTVWMEHGKWEAQYWAFRSVEDWGSRENIEILAWKLADQEEEDG